MSFPEIIGFDGYTLTKQRKGWSKSNGETQILTYKGPKDKIDDYYESIINADSVDSIDMDIDGGMGILEITVVDLDGSGGPVTGENNDVWELVGQDLFRNVRAHETFNQDANQADLEEVREAIEKADKAFAVPAADPEQTYYKLLLRGNDEYVRTSAILRRTINVGPRTLVTAAWEGVDQAWKMNGEEGSPNLRTTGDAQIIGAVNSMPDADATKKQWLKRAPQIRGIGNRRYSLIYEWWFARRWSEVLYGGDEEDGNP